MTEKVGASQLLYYIWCGVLTCASLARSPSTQQSLPPGKRCLWLWINFNIKKPKDTSELHIRSSFKGSSIVSGEGACSSYVEVLLILTCIWKKSLMFKLTLRKHASCSNENIKKWLSLVHWASPTVVSQVAAIIKMVAAAAGGSGSGDITFLQQSFIILLTRGFLPLMCAQSGCIFPVAPV